MVGTRANLFHDKRDDPLVRTPASRDTVGVEPVGAHQLAQRRQIEPRQRRAQTRLAPLTQHHKRIEATGGSARGWPYPSGPLRRLGTRRRRSGLRQ